MPISPITLGRVPAELRVGLTEISRERTIDGTSLFGDQNRTVIDWQRIEEAHTFHVEVAAVSDRQHITIRYGDLSSAWRAFGAVLGQLDENGQVRASGGSSHLRTRGVMVDVSRNAVWRPETIRGLLRKWALMGINTAMLYAEDVYEIPGEPLIGHARGRYSTQELRQIDEWAVALGIELIPCIQTLGHLEQVLKWPRYRHLRDTASILLAEHSESLSLIDRMIGSLSTVFRSRRIHIGLDEAEQLTQGAYRTHFGNSRSASAVFDQHSRAVIDICAKYGLNPMMWSDTFLNTESTDDSGARPVPSANLVYWDYHHRRPELYGEMITRHRRLGAEPIMATGVFTWTRLWAQLPFSFQALDAAMTAVREHKLQEAFVTLWGNDSSECDYFSALPAIQYFADRAFGIERAELPVTFRGSCQGTLQQWLRAGELDQIDDGPDIDTPVHPLGPANPSKWLLWADPIIPFFDMGDLTGLEEHFTRLAEDLTLGSKEKGDEPLAFVVALAKTLTLKARLHRDLPVAYRNRRIIQLATIHTELLPQLAAATADLHHLHRRRWLTINKAFGWDVLDRRYSGLRGRLNYIEELLGDWLADPNGSIEELEIEPLPAFDPDLTSRPMTYRQVTAPSGVS